MLAIVLIAVAISYLTMLAFFRFVYPYVVRGAIEGISLTGTIIVSAVA